MLTSTVLETTIATIKIQSGGIEVQSSYFHNAKNVESSPSIITILT